MDVADRSLFSKQGTFSSMPLDPSHIAQAKQRSPDNGATLVFSKLNLSDIGALTIEGLALTARERPEDENPVKRIAFGNNRLTTLPTEFSLLSHLRYLNLKHNNFSIFPDVLTLMPSLDTLDISHNKIHRLPSQAGHLVNLRVFSLSKNKIIRLPSYLIQFHNLEVLQVERNPIEWPPESVMDNAGDLDSRYAMKEWIHGLQQWMEAEQRNQAAYDSSSEKLTLDTYTETSQYNWRFPLPSTPEQRFSPHSRSFSIDSNFSAFSTSESAQGLEASSVANNRANRPLPLHLGILDSSSSDNSPTRSLESYLPSPADSDFFGDKTTTSIGTAESQYHNRNASDGSGLHLAVHSSLSDKKSMPDLRTAKLNFTKKNADTVHVASSLTLPTQSRGHDDLSTVALPQRQDSGSSFSSNRPALPGTQRTISQSSEAVPSMAFERNSYFQRLSMLPISVALPDPLVCLIDSARSILFAMCQVYQTLEHYMIHAVDDRICSVLRKIVDPASTDMMQLISALDRFDAMSQKTLPSPAICRSVVESCRDTVAVFGKAVGVLALQLKLIVAGDDARYSRWIMLELYGATSEVSSAWRALLPQIEAIKPMLRSKAFNAHPLPSGNVAASEVYAASPTSMLSAHPDPPALLRSAGSSVSAERVRTARRHAGSFSSKDVEIGKKLPSYDDVPHTFGGIVSGLAKNTPTLRVSKRQATIPMTTISSPSPTSPISVNSPSTPAFRDGSYNHSRESSQTSFLTLSTSFKANLLDPPSNSTSLVDKEALQAVQDAIDVAPVVWDMIDDLFNDALGSNPLIRDTIEEARKLTRKLSETIRLLHDVEVSTDRKELREDAHAFMKMVVQLSYVIKTYRGPHVVSSSLRTNMVKLTNSTEEFAILLHVSSFTPSTPRSYTPLLSVSTGPIVTDELRLGSSLSRSRSAQPSGSFKLPFVTQQESPRSALPFKSFKVPKNKYMSSREGAVLDPG